MMEGDLEARRMPPASGPGPSLDPRRNDEFTDIDSRNVLNLLILSADFRGFLSILSRSSYKKLKLFISFIGKYVIH